MSTVANTAVRSRRVKVSKKNDSSSDSDGPPANQRKRRRVQSKPVAKSHSPPAATEQKQPAQSGRIRSNPGSTRYWTPDEHGIFLKYLNKYGRGEWITIARYISTKSPDQVRSHAQKYFLSLENGKSMYQKPLTQEDYQWENVPKPAKQARAALNSSKKSSAHAAGPSKQPQKPRKTKEGSSEGSRRKKPKVKSKRVPPSSDEEDVYQKRYTSGKARRMAINQMELGDENELGDWTTLQCELMNADWTTADGRNKNGLDPLIKYWIKPDVVLHSRAQVRTQEIFEGDQALRDYLKDHPEEMPEDLRAPKVDYLALLR